jgi:hypothetical protein
MASGTAVALGTGVRKSKAERLLDGRNYDEVPNEQREPVFPTLGPQVSASR